MEKARLLNCSGFRAKDALHLACAMEAECDSFPNTDDKIINKNGLVKEVEIIDPIGFVRLIYP